MVTGIESFKEWFKGSEPLLLQTKASMQLSVELRVTS